MRLTDFIIKFGHNARYHWLKERALREFIKSLEKYARRDWSERVHYISIKQAPCVTRLHC